MLDLEVQPERSLGNEQWEFILGMPFSQAVSILKRQDRFIKGVQVWYSDQNPLLTDLVINLSHDGVRLIFDSASQRLKIIEVYNVCKVKLKYCGMTFNSPSVSPTIDQIDQSFGATHPGDYIKEKQIFRLKFRGLTFEFKIDSKQEPRYKHGLGSLQFTSGPPPVVSRMYIYAGNSADDPKPPPLPLQCYQGHCYLESVEVIRDRQSTKGFKFFLATEGNGHSKVSELRKVTCEKTVLFGDTVEDVTSALGSPAKVFFKSEDKMKIHSADSNKLRSRCSDYFYNYYTLGVDILFDATVHRVKKVILRSNYTDHFDFNMYCRCEFKIHIPVDKASAGDGSTARSCRTHSLCIQYDTKWDSIESYLLTGEKKPVVLKRAASTNTTNPFGPTFCYGVQDIIFEVMQNNHIASVLFYEPKTPSPVMQAQHMTHLTPQQLPTKDSVS